MEYKHHLNSYVQFESPEQRNAIAQILKKVGMKWGWEAFLDQPAGIWNKYTCLHITTNGYLEGGGREWGIIDGKNPTDDVIGWAKDMYDQLKEKQLTKMQLTDSYECKFEKGQIVVGCQTIPNDVVREVAKRLID